MQTRTSAPPSIEYYDNPLGMVPGTVVSQQHTFHFPSTLGGEWVDMASGSVQRGQNNTNPNQAFGVFGQLVDIAQQELLQRCEFLPCLGVARKQILQYTEGQSHALHVDDQFQPSREVGRTKWGMNLLNQFGAMVYEVSDDFSGGEIVFPNQSLVITPKTGLVVMWPSNRHFPHEVLPVKTGIRRAYVLHFYITQ